MRRSLLAILLVAGPTAGLLAPACANQGEGERCDTFAGNNGNDDCQSGLVCIGPGQLQWPAPEGGNPQTTTTGICCPPQGGRAPTTAVCGMMSSGFNNDAVAPPPDASEGGGPIDGGEGGRVDASDASDASDGADAPADAPEDGG